MALPDPLFDVLRAYATLQAAKTIVKPELPFGAIHDFLLDHILLNPHFEEFPPSTQYQVSFWKWAIDWLEQAASDPEDEIDERIYTHRIALIQDLATQNLGTSAPPPSYLTYFWPTKSPLARAVYPGYANATLLESRTTIEGGTTGFRTWSASLILAQHLLSHPELVSGRTALELGCGAGFLGIVTAAIQMEGGCEPSSLWLTDVNESVLQRCEDNVRLRCNQSSEHPKVHFRALDWSDATDAERCSSVLDLFREARPDILVGADVVYDPSIIQPLVQTLTLALAPRDDGQTPEAYIALAQRNTATLSDFVSQAGRRIMFSALAADVRAIEQRLRVERIRTQLVNDNIFTGSAELGQGQVSQTVQIFRLSWKT